MNLSFFPQLLQNCQDHPDAVAISYGISGGTTYAKLDEVTGRIANYLIQHHIGHEDFVMIDMPRSAECFMACIGVWRAGAAFVVCEHPSPKADFIYADCRCKIRFTADQYEEALHCDYRAGFTETDPHCAAYAIYTSGTTQNPKGIIQEYGQIQTALRNANNYEGQEMYVPDDTVSFIGPFTTLAALIIGVVTFFIGGEFNIVPYASVKNIDLLLDYLNKKQTTATFLPPSLASLIKEFPPCIHTVIVGSEAVSNIYFDKVNLYNEYSQSETGTVTARFKIDKPYPITPIGKTYGDTPELMVLDEDGKKCPPGVSGELCQENPYFRGYINLPEETEKAFRAGIYHTGDIGAYLPDGNIVYLGRADDMVKINGNRVEPATIEAVVKEVLHIRWAAAKVVYAYDKTFICVYYTENPQTDPETAKEAISSKLPAYMHPSYYIKIDQIPRNAAGKLVRSKLPDPDISGLRKRYLAPRTGTERKVTAVLEKVLDTPRIGVDEDLFELGLNSLSAIMTITELGIETVGVNDLYTARTVEAFAKVCAAAAEKHAAKAELRELPLLDQQEFFCYFEEELPGTTGFNVPMLFKLNPKADLEKLSSSITEVISKHQVFQTVLRKKNGAFTQELTSRIQEPEMVSLSEREFKDKARNLVQPFELYNHLLYRIKIFKTEKNSYLFADIHHVITDGTSMKRLLAEVYRVYQGGEISQDAYFSFVKKQIDIQHSEAYEKDKAYYLSKITAKDRLFAPVYDYESDGHDIAYLDKEANISETDLAQMQKYYKLTPNEYFCLCYLTALSRVTGNSRVGMAVVADARNSLEEQNIVGALIRTYHINLDIEKTDSYEEINRRFRAEMTEADQHRLFNLDAAPEVEYKTADVIYQDRMYNYDDYQALLKENIELSQQDDNADTDVEIEILNQKHSMEFEVWYNASRYAKKTIRKLIAEYVKVCKDMLHSIKKEAKK